MQPKNFALSVQNLSCVNIRRAVCAALSAVVLVVITAFTANVGRADVMQSATVCYSDGSGPMIVAAEVTFDSEGGVHWGSAIIGYLDASDDTVLDDIYGNAIGFVIYGS